MNEKDLKTYWVFMRLALLLSLLLILVFVLNEKTKGFYSFLISGYLGFLLAKYKYYLIQKLNLPKDLF